MKKNNRTFVARRLATPLIAVLLCVLLAPDRCKAQNTALLLQQTPPNGGILTPGSGVHSFGTNTDITLKAVPNPGYQFVYWLGDVSDSGANATIVLLDAPKIIIAVFERTQHDFSFLEEFIKSAPVGGLSGGAADYARTGYSGGGAKRPSASYGSNIPPLPPDQPPDFPTPDDNGDFPVPEVPEPATALLMALGAAISCLKRRQKYKN